MADHVEIRELTADEIAGHAPPADAPENWQESWGFSWHDPIRRAGGINHISIWRNRGYADVWSWVALDGEVVGKFQSLNLDMPDEDFPNWALGGQRITQHSGRSCSMRNSYESGTQVDLDYEAFTDPLAFSVDVDGTTWGSSHFESIGRVTGTVTVGGEATEVAGMAWQDHSWGARRWADTLSHRWIMAGFGPDLFISAIQVITEKGGAVPIGFVYDSGRLHRVTQTTFGSRMADDGHTPVGCDAQIWTDAGHGYRVLGEVHTASPSSHVEGFWFTDGLCIFECGGRLGAGMLEIQELNRPTRAHREQLGLDVPGAVPAAYAV